MENNNTNNPIIIKKYANRRLYNTSTSAYVTLDDLAELVKQGKAFEVVDAKTGDDMTRPVLAQIIFEQESQGTALLPLNFMRQLIQFYDHTLQNAVPHYLETALDVFRQNQDQFTTRTKDALAPFGLADTVETLAKIRQQNMALIQQSWQLFNPFFYANGGSESPAEKTTKLAELKQQAAELNAQIAALEAKKQTPAN